MTPYMAARAAFARYAGMDAPQLPEERISAMQVRLARWQNRHFPGSGTLDHALGVGEEVGELVEALLPLFVSVGRLQHYVLKNRQRIRGLADEERFRELASDAIADTSIFLIQLSTTLRIDFLTLLLTTASEVLERDWSARPAGG